MQVKSSLRAITTDLANGISELILMNFALELIALNLKPESFIKR